MKCANEKTIYEILRCTGDNASIGHDEIAGKLRLNRQYVLDILERLRNKELVKEKRRYCWLTPTCGMRSEVAITQKGKKLLDLISEQKEYRSIILPLIH